MRIEIEIPKEFEEHFKQDKFKNSFDNLLKEYNSELLRVANQVDISYEYDDVCEWYKVNGNAYKCYTHAEIYDSRVLDWYVCPYCGKKIKVVE